MNDFWTYEQKTGHWLDENLVLVAIGYSGHPPHVDDPAAQDIKNCGPIPCGRYKQGTPFTSARTGPFAIPLTPYPSNEMFNRSAFEIHGDNIHNPGDGSDGCICAIRPARERYSKSGLDLVVVSGVTTPMIVNPELGT